jgi:hypothetical protein
MQGDACAENPKTEFWFIEMVDSYGLRVTPRFEPDISG